MRIGLVLLVSLVWVSPEESRVVVSPGVWKQLEMAQDGRAVVWVFLRDKESHEKIAVSEQTQARRERRGRSIPAHVDLPVRERYVRELSQAGLEIRRTSRWLNAVSGFADAQSIAKIREFPWVRSVSGVAGYSRGQEPREADHRPRTLVRSAVDTAWYGASFSQLNTIKVPLVHDAGVAGDGVTIGVFDTGFDNLGHRVFDSLRIVDAYDFVNEDDDVSDEGDMGFGDHGTATLSVLAGYDPGAMIGPAFRSQFILAKTENTQSETSLEEDNWIAAIEWAEALGVDIVSSSLGYLQMDPGSPRNYDAFWMSGDSMPITKAANLAVSLGVIVVNSAGNEGIRSPNSLSGPGDGDSVITAGAIGNSGLRASFSSVGPTTKGKIKPDVMAPGVGVRVASSNQDFYDNLSGTSFSCPLVAGVCAQILSAHPSLTPSQVKWALLSTAAKSSSDSDPTPNNLYGYGIVNAAAAINVYGDVVDPRLVIPTTFRLYPNFPNPFNPETTIRFDVPTRGRVRLEVYNMLGQRVRRLVDEVLDPLSRVEVQWNGRDDRGSELASGVYVVRLSASGFVSSRRLMLLK